MNYGLINIKNKYSLTSFGVITGNRKPSGILQKSWTPPFKGRMQLNQVKVMMLSYIHITQKAFKVFMNGMNNNYKNINL